MKKIIVAILLLISGTTMFADSFANIADKLLSESTVNVLKKQDIAIVCASDPVSSDFAIAFQNKVKNFATVVFTDHKVIQKEIDRQMSGIVDDKEIVALGHERGADIVIQLILCRIPDNLNIKVIMTAVYVEGNSLAASDVVITSIPSNYDINRLPLQSEDAMSVVKKMTNRIVASKIDGIYDEPLNPIDDEPVVLPPPPPPAPPPPPPPPQKIVSWWGVNLTYTGYFSDPALNAFRIGLEYGRFGDGWDIKDRICFEVSPINIYNVGVGFDANVGYSLWHLQEDKYILASLISSVGFTVIPNDITSSFIPYIQLKGNISFPLPSLSLRLSPIAPYIGLTGGLSFQMEF
jgi:hypothetical protein